MKAFLNSVAFTSNARTLFTLLTLVALAFAATPQARAQDENVSGNIHTGNFTDIDTAALTSMSGGNGSSTTDGNWGGGDDSNWLSGNFYIGTVYLDDGPQSGSDHTWWYGPAFQMSFDAFPYIYSSGNTSFINQYYETYRWQNGGSFGTPYDLMILDNGGNLSISGNFTTPKDIAISGNMWVSSFLNLANYTAASAPNGSLRWNGEYVQVYKGGSWQSLYDASAGGNVSATVYDTGTEGSFGTVGIGTLTPNTHSILAVNGTLAIGVAYATNSSITTPTNGLIVSGAVGIGTNTTGNNTLNVTTATGAALLISNTSNVSIGNIVGNSTGLTVLNTGVIYAANTGNFDTYHAPQGPGPYLEWVPQIGRFIAANIGNVSSFDSSSQVAIGTVTIVGEAAVAIGSSSALNKGAVAIGYASTSQAFSSVSIGTDNQAINDGSVAIGFDNSSYGGNGTVDIGMEDSTSGIQAIAIGSNNTASGTISIALGNNSVASNSYAIAMGGNNSASGVTSLALGYNVNVSGNGSMALGGNIGNITSNHTLVFGQWSGNITGNGTATDPLFVLANGNSTTPSTAFTVLQNGNTTIKGTLSGNAGNLTIASNITLTGNIAGPSVGNLTLTGNVTMPKRQGDIVMGQFGNGGGD